MAIVSMKQLLEAGVHFGHQTRRWNPKMAPYIYTERNGIYIIDLQKTVKKLEEAYNFVRQLSENGESLLFVGTKKQAQEAIKEEAGSLAQVSEGIGQISSVVQTNSASSEESAAVSSELFEQVNMLKEQTRRFRLKHRD